MAADLASSMESSRAYGLFTLRADFDRDIDFDFFDDSRAPSSTSPWRGEDDAGGGGAPRTPPGAGPKHRDDDGNLPSPRLTAGPTPTCSSGSGGGGDSLVSSSSSLPQPLDTARTEDGDDEANLERHQDQLGDIDPPGHGGDGDDDVLEDVVVAAQRPAAAPTEAIDQMTAARAVNSDTSAPTRTDATESEAADEPSGPGASERPPADGSAAPDGLDGLPGEADDVPREKAQQVSQVAPLASTPSAPTRELPALVVSAPASSSSSEASEDSAGAAISDGEGEDDDDECVAIQELTLTVCNRKTRAVSSITAVSSVAVGDEDSDDTDAEDAIEAITKALHRARPIGSASSLPVPLRAPPPGPGRGRGGRSRRLNMSFSNDEARRIQRDNERLLRRIVGQRARPPPTRTAPTPPPRPSAVGAAPFLAPPSTHHCSHAVNRVRRGRDIERENQILLKKIQSVKRSPSQLSVSRSSSSMSGRYSCG